MPIRNLMLILSTCFVSLLCYEKAPRNRYASTLASAMDLIEQYYVEPIESRDLFENAMDGLVGKLDEYSDYIPPSYYDRFQEVMDQQFVGIGIEVVGPPNEDQVRVVSPVFGTPAYEAGIRADDVILEIDGVSVEGIPLDETIGRIKGPPGSVVTLTVLHRDTELPVVMNVTRQLIQTESVLGDRRGADGAWQFYLKSDPEISYARINTFGELTAGELKKVLETLPSNSKGLILDLRGNAGGLLQSAVQICDMFLEQGEIVRIKSRIPFENETYRAGDAGFCVPQQLPVVVLIDRLSASASEIVAACLQDNQRATIVGQRSWGKGSVQNIIPMESGKSALKLTTASYWRPSGRNIHRMRDATDEDEWGVSPDAQGNVVLDEQEMLKVMEARRKLDVIAGKGIPTVDDPEAAAVVDRQLQKAIEIINPDSGP